MKKMSITTLAAALILAASLYAPVGHAYVLLGVNWNYLGGSPVTVNIYINPNCADPTAPNELTSLQSAMTTWGAAGANFAFNYAGYTSVTNASFNGQNDVCWNSGSSGGALATTYMWGGGGNMTQADMVFWDGSWTWSTSWPTFAQFDVESVGLHEFGHIVGLDHSQYNYAVMWYAIANGEVQRTLSSDDLAGILAIYGAGGSVNLTVDMNPTGPTTVPSGGGNISYTVSIHNNGAGTANFAAWTEYLNQAGQSYGYVIQRPSLSLTGGGTIFRSLTLTIAGSLPAGTYTYYCRTAASLGGTPYYAQDNFQFIKTALDNGEPWVWETTSTGWDDDTPILSAVVPEDFRVVGPYPNPFNPETAIQFDLPQATRLNLAIYDVQGRKLVELLDGNLDAGRYTAVWNAADYPSGTYLYRLTSDLETVSGKMVLMK
jgi:hypothetical protein